MNQIIYIAFFLIAASTITAQQTNWEQAVLCYQKDSLICASEKIDLAIKDSNEVKDPYTWHVRAFIYREIYKTSSNEQEKNLAREKSVEAFSMSLSLDKEDEQKLKTNNIKGLESIATGLYNEGVNCLQIFEVEKGMEFFEKHNKTLKLIDENYVIQEREISIKKAAAAILTDRYNDDNEGNSDAFNKAIEYYNDILKIDSNDFKTNLNIGVLYHNKGINLLTGTRLDLTLPEIMKLQKNHVFYMQKSLQYMTKAYQTDKNHPGVIRALAGAYYSLHDDEKHEFYNQKLIKLEGTEGAE